MLLQIVLPSEFGAAKVAIIRPPVAINASVIILTALIAETHAAYNAGYYFRIRVYGIVFLQILLPPETTIALAATIRRVLRMVETVRV